MAHAAVAHAFVPNAAKRWAQAFGTPAGPAKGAPARARPALQARVRASPVARWRRYTRQEVARWAQRGAWAGAKGGRGRTSAGLPRAARR